MTETIAESPTASNGQAEFAPNIQLDVPSYETANGWVTYKEGEEYGVTLEVQNAGQVNATLRVDSDDNRDLYIDEFHARPEAEQGAGKAMVAAAVAEGRKYGADTLTGHFTNDRALGAVARVVGEDNVHYFDRYTGQPTDIALGQAMQSPEDYYVRADISHVEVPAPTT